MIIYDIACQYIIHFNDHVGHLLPADQKIDAAIGLFCQNSGGSELRSRYGGHVIKTWLQLVCCALVWELECLVISGSRNGGVSGMEYGWTENLVGEQRDYRGYDLGF